MTPQQVQQIIDALRSAAGQGFQLLVQGQIVTGVQEVVTAVVLLIIATGAILGLFAIHRASQQKEDWEDDFTSLLLGMFCLFPALGCPLASVFLLSDGIEHLVIPASFAVQQLLPGS
jgi:RsiW-degrading membrane proteinase PrsW (M82 family)